MNEELFGKKMFDLGKKQKEKDILEIIDKTIKETTNLLEKVGMVKIKQQIKEKGENDFK